MAPPIITDPAQTRAGTRILAALDRYEALTNKQLNYLLEYSPEAGIVKKATSEIAREKYVFKGNSISNPVSLDGHYKPGPPEHVVSVLEKGRSTNRRDPRRRSYICDHLIALNWVLNSA